MDISAPIPLARLPRSSGQDVVHFGTVYTVRNGLKKRREELCVAVDGDSLGLYEVQNGSIVASYPVPPTSRFLGSPCSIHEKADGQNIRTTYCAIKRDGLRVEAFKTSTEDSARPTSVVSPALRDQDSPVALLDVVPGSSEKQVVVVQQNGNLTIFSEDLQTASIETSVSSPHLESLKVWAIQILSLSEAQKTILKQRPDVTSAAAPEASYLAVAYGRTEQPGSIDNLHYGVWVIDSAGGNTASNERSLNPLFEHDISQGKSQSSPITDKYCSFNSRASNIFVRVGQTLLTYDLTGLVPSLSSTLYTGASGNYGVMALSPVFALCSFQDSLRLYDLKYQSMQAQREMKQANLKRKRNMALPDGSGPIELVAYYPRSARIIGRWRNQLLAIDINMVAPKRLLETGSNLLHNIGRGSFNQGASAKYHEKHLLLETGRSTATSKPTADWEALRQQLDNLAQTGDVAGFESAFIDDIRKTATQASRADASLDDLLTELGPLPDYKIHYLLSTIFQVETSSNVAASGQSPTNKRLKVRIPCFKLILWISHMGLLSTPRVKAAITNAASNNNERFATHAVAQALFDADPSCALLVGCLANGFSSDTEEQVAVVQMLIQRALETSPETIDAGPKSQANGTREIPLTFTKASSEVVTFATMSSENPRRSTSLQEALIAALDNFGTAAGPTISSSLKAVFSQTEVLALIQFLRQQLFQAGHTRSFQILPTTTGVPRTVRFDAAIKILSSCVDAIGPLGFFGALDDEDFLGNIIPELVTEVTNTKDSFEDVSELQGILRETLRYQESIQRYQVAGARIQSYIAGTVPQQRPGAIMTLYSEAVEGEENVQGVSSLPLSLKVENVINPVKMRKGGGHAKQRTVRQKRMMERRNKGQYAFERLVL